ncbi:MAG: glycosyltransferase family 39 protein [Planctomycetes bacterium]|nr:glycosyltransferase family 39 protein [Planctomycetota bacterium]
MAPPSTAPDLAPPPRTRNAAAWLPALLGLLYTVLAACLAFALHPIVLNEAESDNFLRGLESLLRGGPCIDTYHPAHTVLFGALVVKLTGCEPFAALRLVAAVGGGAIVAITLGLARRFGAGALGAGLAMLLLGLHPGLLLLSMQASADTLATALMLATLLVAVRGRQSRRGRDALLCGLLFGLAVGTRFSCLGFAPALLGVLHRGQLLRGLLQASAGFAVGYAPHGIVSTLQFGSPFFTDNWRNFVLKHGQFDALLLVDPGYPNLFAFLREHWLESLQIGLADVWLQVAGGFGEVLTSGAPAPWSTLIGAIALGAIGWLAVRRRSIGWILALCFGSYLALICLSYSPIERVLLPLLPPATVALAAMVHRGAWWSTAIGGLALAATCMSLALHLPARLERFVDAHPFREIEVARDLVARSDVEVAAASYAYMARHVPGTTYVYPIGPGPRRQADPYGHLRDELLRTGANGFVIGRRTSADTFRALRGATPPYDVHVVRADDDVVALVFLVAHDDGGAAGRWFLDLQVTPAQWHDGPLSLQVELTPASDVAAVESVAVRFEVAPGKGPTLDLPRLDDRRWGIEWSSRPPPGRWTIGTRIRLRDGRYIRGPRREITVD